MHCPDKPTQSHIQRSHSTPATPCCTNYSKSVYFHVTRSWNYVLYMDLDFQIVTLSSIKWHKSTCVNGFSVTDKLCVHVWAVWQVQMSTLTFLSSSGRWVGY